MAGVVLLADGAGRARAAPEAGERVVAFPGPGWRYASPDTTITVQGATAEQLAGMRVVGSRSGTHAGSLRPLRLGPGAVFDPERPFEPNERVRVDLPVPVHGAGGRSFRFRVQIPSPDQPPPDLRPPGAVTALARHRACPLRHRRVHRRRLRTLPGHRPVATCMWRRRRGALPGGPILLSPRPRDTATDHDPALMILSGDGRLLWHSPQSVVVHDLKPVQFNGRPHLAYYVRVEPTYYELLNERYEVATRIYAGNGFGVNAHDMQVTPRETAYLAIYRRVRVPGTGHRVTDFVVQEIDLITRDVMFEWHSLDHVPVWASYDPRPTDGTAYDYFHGNSIEPPRPGDDTIVISARKTSAIYGIDRSTGEMRWILGGKQDQFGLDRHPTWRFCAQHDARWLPNGDLTIFDNGGYNLGNLRDCPLHSARVLQFRLDTRRKRARLVKRIRSRWSSDDRRGFKLAAVGSARRVSGGDMLVSWGTAGRVTQHSPGGRVKMKLQLERWTYRAMRANWTGTPAKPPAVVARRRDGRAVDVYASWNGATEIRRWQVLAGDTPQGLAPVGRPYRFRNLETRMRVRTDGDYIAVEALDRRGRPLARSRTVRVGGG